MRSSKKCLSRSCLKHTLRILTGRRFISHYVMGQAIRSPNQVQLLAQQGYINRLSTNLYSLSSTFSITIFLFLFFFYLEKHGLLSKEINFQPDEKWMQGGISCTTIFLLATNLVRTKLIYATLSLICSETDGICSSFLAFDVVNFPEKILIFFWKNLLYILTHFLFCPEQSSRVSSYN